MQNKSRTLVKQLTIQPLVEMKKQNKNQKTFQLNVKGYSLVIEITNDGKFASIYRGKEKMPLIGSNFKYSTMDDIMVGWANQRLEKHLSGEDAQQDKELLSMFKDMI